MSTTGILAGPGLTAWSFAAEDRVCGCPVVPVAGGVALVVWLARRRRAR